MNPDPQVQTGDREVRDYGVRGVLKETWDPGVKRGVKELLDYRGHPGNPEFPAGKEKWETLVHREQLDLRDQRENPEVFHRN